jgi:hypothetical protein
VAVSVRVSVSVCLKKREEKEKKREENFSSATSYLIFSAAAVFLPNCIVSSQHALGALPRIRV